MDLTKLLTKTAFDGLPVESWFCGCKIERNIGYEFRSYNHHYRNYDNKTQIEYFTCRKEKKFLKIHYLCVKEIDCNEY